MKIRPQNIVIILCFVSTILCAKVLYVDQDISDGFWANSYAELGTALKEAKTGDEIWVANGKYVPGREIHNSFVIKEGVKLYGGFYGGETKLSDRDLNVNHSILSGEIGIKNRKDDNILHIILCCQTERERPLGGDREREKFDVSRETSYFEREKSDVSRETEDLTRERTIIDGFTISDGNASSGKGGGGLFCESVLPPLIRNCRFINNTSKKFGGAIYSECGVDIVSCLFNANTAKYGGAIYIADSKIEDKITKSTFYENSALDGAVVFCALNQVVRIDSCIMLNNYDNCGILNTLCSNGVMKNYYMVSNVATDDESILRSQNISNITCIREMEEEIFQTSKLKHTQNDENVPLDYGFNLCKRNHFINVSLFNNDTF